MAGSWEWDDVRFFLVASREGSLSGAARALGVDHVTVGRRIAALEERLGAKLLTRTPEGLAPTSPGQAILKQCQTMESAALDIERMVAGHDSRFVGPIRLTTTETLASYVVVPQLAALRRRYLELQLEIITSVRILDIARREAEIAVRPVRPTASNLVCRKLGDLGFAMYASRDYLARHGFPRRGHGLAGHFLIGHLYNPASGFGPLFMNESLEGAEIVVRSNTSTVQAQAAADGLGICELACALGDSQPALVRVWPNEPPTLRSIWLVTHEDMRRAAKIRLVSAAIAEAFQRNAKLLRDGQPRRPRG
ncbi:MAG TPA: LysR family transcriptional regulator [Candidatus Binataceae bacterium]|nr:LysR family transcriptional regulator [Candidatus Binataceae bacterium]